MIEFKTHNTDVKIFTNNIEQEALSQVYKMANHHVFNNPIRIMPDVHAGRGSVVGFTMQASKRGIIPAVIGVDIGCGMRSIKIAMENVSNEMLQRFDDYIKQTIPLNKEVNKESRFSSWEGFIKIELSRWQSELRGFLKRYFDISVDLSYLDMDYLVEGIFQKIGMSADYAFASIGSLGGGNHFIEFGIDDEGFYYLTVHTGSRNFGKKVCDYWQSKAEKDNGAVERQRRIDELKQKLSGVELGQAIERLKKEYQFKGKDLSYLSTEENIAGYLVDMYIAQKYAQLNRRVIITELLGFLLLEDKDLKVMDDIESVHNYIDFRDGIIRKGAIRAYPNELMVIPFNMRDGLIIAEGKGLPDWNYSAPHGAGRLLSRGKAKEMLDIEEFKEQMAGIVTSSVGEHTLDESPMAYKSKDEIIQALDGIVDIKAFVKPLLNVKG